MFGDSCSVFPGVHAARGPLQYFSSLFVTEFWEGSRGEIHQISRVTATDFRNCIRQSLG